MTGRPPPTTSGATRPFFDAARRGRLAVPWCGACGRHAAYGRPFCPTCLGAPLSWREVSGRGVVYSYTVVRRSRDPYFAGQVPYLVAVVELDEGIRLLTNLVRVQPEDARIGLRVRATFEAAGSDTVPVFVPDPEQAGP
jgi:uncharacterized OB-fold protein